jgi:hypothetical protein
MNTGSLAPKFAVTTGSILPGSQLRFDLRDERAFLLF